MGQDKKGCPRFGGKISFGIEIASSILRRYGDGYVGSSGRVRGDI